ncbi:hypothetical protein MA16_Dca013882 [Dendrobium catenatum]|uniref:Uncharacterized protein n=1 Tax=Dendrobium catenatum TaxID=906689 RepID=A0A2I0WCN3_9ASPA|nr:hypothetical protein MA16_Dca013882 [Dendrobium catenatum]
MNYSQKHEQRDLWCNDQSNATTKNLQLTHKYHEACNCQHDSLVDDRTKENE